MPKGKVFIKPHMGTFHGVGRHGQKVTRHTMVGGHYRRK